MSETHVGIQWKGTKACLDLNCECGGHSHADPEMPFSGVLRCPYCERTWYLSHSLRVQPLDSIPADDWRRSRDVAVRARP